MVSVGKKKNQQRRQFNQLTDTLNDFVIGNNSNIFAIGNETLQPQANGRYDNAEKTFYGENITYQNEVIENNIDDKLRKLVDVAVLTVENRMHDAILTALDNVVFPRVEMAVKSITGSSGQGPSSVVQNPKQRDFTGNTENTSLMLAASQLNLNVDQDRDDWTRNVENF